MSSVIWFPPKKKTLYDWDEPGYSLKPLGNDNPRHTVVLVRFESLYDMLRGGFLTGGAKQDAESGF